MTPGGEVSALRGDRFQRIDDGAAVAVVPVPHAASDTRWRGMPSSAQKRDTAFAAVAA